MYYSGQIVYSIDRKQPVKIGDDVWNEKSYPIGKTIHFINGAGKIICPKSVEEAKLLLKRRRIVPAPISDELCWSCDYRLQQKPKDTCKAKDEHEKCFECGGFGIYSRKFGKPHCDGCTTKLADNAFLSVTEKLLAAIKKASTKNIAIYHDGDVCKAFDNLKELMDPYGVKAHGVAINISQEMAQLYAREHRKS